MRLHFIDREGRGEIQKECKGKLWEKLVGEELEPPKKKCDEKFVKIRSVKNSYRLRYKAKYILNSVGGKS